MAGAAVKSFRLFCYSRAKDRIFEQVVEAEDEAAACKQVATDDVVIYNVVSA